MDIFSHVPPTFVTVILPILLVALIGALAASILWASKKKPAPQFRAFNPTTEDAVDEHKPLERSSKPNRWVTYLSRRKGERLGILQKIDRSGRAHILMRASDGGTYRVRRRIERVFAA